MNSDSSTIAENTAARLRHMILSGRIQPGEPLRQEDLAKELNVSRTPLRQAFQILGQDGLVEHTGFKGASIKKVTPKLVEELFSMREVLEPLALRLALPNMTKVDLAHAEIALDKSLDTSDPVELADLNQQFHVALYAPSQHGLLLESIERLNRTAALASVIAQSIDVRQQASNDEHLSLLTACKEGDHAKTTAVLSVHLKRARDDLLKQFKD